MVNDIVFGIAKTLDSNFADVPIYTDNVEQGLEMPCFFIMPITSDESPLLNIRAMRHVAFDIHYLSNSGRVQLENIASQLYGIFRKVKINDKTSLAGLNLNHQIIDDTLHFFVEFKFTVWYEGESVQMQQILKQDLGVKNEEEKRG